jgi:hypothetical protein
LKTEGNPHIPFSLFISSYRRRKILDAMMSKESSSKTEGKVILSNYKKQLAERMVREKTEAGANLNMSAAGSKADASSNKPAAFEFNANDPPEPEVLLAILDPKKR